MASIQFTNAMEIIMKRKTFHISATAVAAVALGLVLANGSDTVAHPINGQSGFAGPGYGMGYGMVPGQGRGMMGRQGGGWMMGGAGTANSWPGAVWGDADKDGTLSVDEVKKFIETRHAANPNAPFKLGEVTQKDENTISAQMLDASGNVVRTMEIPTKVNQAASNQPAYGQGFGMRGGQMGYGKGYGMRGYHQGGGYGRHGGQMGYGMRGNQMGGGYGAQGYRMGMGFAPAAITAPVTVDSIKSIVAARLSMWSNPNLKLGEVVEKDENTISAEIVTIDGSLVQRLEFDRKTGRPNVIR